MGDRDEQRVDPESRARTHLANERTFLAWLRTGLGLIVLGLAVAQFMGVDRDLVSGLRTVTDFSAMLILSGSVFALVGGVRYFRGRGEIEAARFQPAGRGIVVAMLLVVVIGLRERETAGQRRTRAIMADVGAALDRYLAEHEGQCPQKFAQLLPYGHFKDVPRDAWGNPLRLTCPSPRGDLPYQLSSDGPDGKPGGLDRIE